MTDSALTLLGLALRGNNLAVGEAPVEEACKTRRAWLVLSAADAAQNSVDRAMRWAEAGGAPWVRVPWDKGAMGSVPLLIPVGYTYEEKNRPPLTLLEDLANPAEGCSLQTLLPPPRPQISLPSHLSSAPRVCDPRATTQPIIEILDEQPSPSPRAVPLPGCIQEGKTTPGKPQIRPVCPT